jgi:hypothetical protein
VGEKSIQSCLHTEKKRPCCDRGFVSCWRGEHAVELGAKVDGEGKRGEDLGGGEGDAHCLKLVKLVGPCETPKFGFPQFVKRILKFDFKFVYPDF